ncbi:MAG: hypothetical protein KF795_03280 [Labilithrix sp.]|nr:hypothetical protein [Labilithrix sp.]
MPSKDPVDVARRCLCLELLLQRLGLETDTDDPAAERDEVRRRWVSRLGDLALEAALLPDERALLERPVGALTEDDLDDLHGRASGALVLLWSLGRIATRPSFGAVGELESIVAEHGLLGTGSIARANESAAGALLRPEAELREALAAYGKTRGKAREPSDPEKIVAAVGAHHLEWILDRAMPFDVGS